MNLHIILILYWLTVTIEGIVGGIGIYCYKKVSKPLRSFTWLLLFWFAMSVIEYLVVKLFHIHNLWLLHCVTLVETILILSIIYQWRIGKTNGILLIVSGLAFTCVWIIGKFTFEPMNLGDDITSTISTIFILSFLIYLMVHILQEEGLSLKNDARFWVASGLLIYFTGTFLLFSLFNYILTIPREVMQKLFTLNWMLTIISDILFARAFFADRKRVTFMIKGLLR